MVNQNLRNDCVFKKTKDGGERFCTFPKTVKICRFCSCYVKNNTSLETDNIYIDFVLRKQAASASIIVSIFSLIVAMLALITSVVTIFVTYLQLLKKP